MRWIGTSYRRSWKNGALVLALLLRGPALRADDVASELPAQRVSDAEALAARAYEAYAAGDFAGAVALYHRAFQRAPSADALFNIARIYDLGLRDRPLAISFYRRYLGDPGAVPERIQRASARLAELRLAEQAEVASTAAPSLYGFDGAPAPSPTFSSPPPSAEPADEGAGGLSPWRVAAIATGTTGAVATALGVVFGVTVLSDARRANDDCDGNRCRSQLGVDAAEAASSHATLASWGVGVGAGLMATGALLWLLEPDDEPSEPPRHVQLGPVAAAHELGLALSGRW